MRTYRVMFCTKHEAHHYRPDWGCKRRHGSDWHSVMFKTKQNADRFARLLDRLGRMGIIGGYIMSEILA